MLNEYIDIGISKILHFEQGYVDCTYTYLHLQSSQQDHHPKVIIIILSTVWSDNCVGQNNMVNINIRLDIIQHRMYTAFQLVNLAEADCILLI